MKPLKFFSAIGIVGRSVPLTGDDPLTVRPPDSPNWAIAAPQGVETAAPVTVLSPVGTASAEELLDAFTQTALSDKRVEHIEGQTDQSLRVFVQRSAIFGFSDVISARAIALPDGMTAIVAYSRSVYGYSDFGVNKQRLKKWIAGNSGFRSSVRSRKQPI
jgi:uncharacterized protein (DUF1499 family)